MNVLNRINPLWLDERDQSVIWSMVQGWKCWGRDVLGGLRFSFYFLKLGKEVKKQKSPHMIGVNGDETNVKVES